jgi:hypothetical protein
MEDVLKMASLEELQNELARREALTKEKALAELPGDILKSEIENKKLSEFEQTYQEMFPWDTRAYDFMYPEMREEREAKVREFLKYKKGDNRTLEQQMYPSLGVK